MTYERVKENYQSLRSFFQKKKDSAGLGLLESLVSSARRYVGTDKFVTDELEALKDERDPESVARKSQLKVSKSHGAQVLDESMGSVDKYIRNKYPGVDLRVHQSTGGVLYAKELMDAYEVLSKEKQKPVAKKRKLAVK